MKIINLNENQYIRLFEREITTIGSNNPSPVKEYPGSEVMVTANITDADGNTEFGNPITTDEFEDDMTSQNPFLRGSRAW